MEAQKTLQALQKTVNDYLGLTIELGRVPTSKEVSDAGSQGGCCGGGGGGDNGGGCGC